MTKERAKKVLQEQIGIIQEYDEEDIEALEMAIKALEQIELNPSYNGVKTELEPCEDCISREDALEEACEFVEIGYNGKGIFVRLKELPSVTPARSKGKWKAEHTTAGYTVYVCSNCDDCYTTSLNEMNYCPRCGADMRGDEE